MKRSRFTESQIVLNQDRADHFPKSLTLFGRKSKKTCMPMSVASDD